jgi:hypothetical protein
MSFVPNTPSNTDDAGRMTLRRLILAKQMFFHAADHARYASGLDKMIAVHNFHNSIEIALKAIVLHYALPVSKKYSIGLDQLQKDIDEFFRPQGVQLPYSYDLANLNTERNLVQHNAHEPESSSMDEWRVITEKFLKRTFELYFGLDFGDLSQLYLISDSVLRSLLEAAVDLQKGGSAKGSLVLLAFAVEMAIQSSIELPGLNPVSAVPSGYVDGSGGLKDALTSLAWDVEQLSSDLIELASVVEDVALQVALIGRGITLAEHRKFVSIVPEVSLSSISVEIDTDVESSGDGVAVSPLNSEEKLVATYGVRWGQRQLILEDTKWAFQYAVSFILQLQNSEPVPTVRALYAELAERLINARGELPSFDWSV